MKFNFSKIILPLDLGEYHEAYAGQSLQVWVNPPRAKRLERETIIKEYPQALAKIISPDRALTLPSPSGRGETNQMVDDLVQASNRKMFVWLVEIWSQHADPETRWSLDEVITVYDADPAFYTWMTRRTIELMDEFRDGQKKPRGRCDGGGLHPPDGSSTMEDDHAGTTDQDRKSVV